MTLHIREARVQDAPALAALWHEMAAFHAQHDPLWKIRRGGREEYAAAMQEVVRSKEQAVFVACEGERPVGFVLAQLDRRARVFAGGEHGLIADLAVTEAFRRRGVGERLLRRSMRWFSSKGVKTAEVRVATTNPVSAAFWRKMGFEPCMTLCRKELSSG